jgi:outer membrane receptor protein involved in Fe transport
MTGARPTRSRWKSRARRLFACALLLFAGLAPPGARAQTRDDEVSDVFEGFGSARTVEEGADGGTASAAKPGEGTILGQVFDGNLGTPVAGVSVIVTWPAPADGSEPRIEVKVTDAAGAFEFPSVPAGSYTISFTKSGYRASSMTGFVVQAGQLNRADFPLPPVPSEASDQVLELDAFVVEASTVGEMINALELRMESDIQLNVMSAEDFSRFASTDVADALKRVAGVNVVEGQFAIIRGLEDRYSSTLYNSAPVPSPDPDRQSVQLDLFPTEVVENLVVAKTFAPELPSNSSGGSIDIVTHDYPPENFTFKLKGAVGFNENSIDTFYDFNPIHPIGELLGDPSGVLGPEAGVFAGGRTELFGREIRLKGVVNWEVGYDTAEGWQETREPVRALIRNENFPNENVGATGGLAFGELELSGGRFELTTSVRSEQIAYYGGFGVDLDEEGNHRLDASAFYTKKQEEIVQLRENGYLPGFPYADQDPEDFNSGVAFMQFGRPIHAIPGSFLTNVKDVPTDSEVRDGPVYWAHFADSRSFDRNRDLLVTQLNGSHVIEQLPGLELRWAGNWARTKQDDDFRSLQYFYQPDCGRSATASPTVPEGCVPESFPATVEALGPGMYGANARASGRVNDVQETSYFGRGDGTYETELGEFLGLEFGTGGWYEHASREVEAQGLGLPRGNFFREADTAQRLGEIFFVDETTTPQSPATNEAAREIWAWNVGSKATFWDRFDLLGGVRLENLEITSENEPFTGRDDPRIPGLPLIFPSRYLMFDRRDDPRLAGETPTAPAFTVFNDQILRQPVEVDRTTTACDKVDPQTGMVDRRGCVNLTDAQQQSLLSGSIDERMWLPAAGFAVRPLDGLSLRGSWSQTVARPSFREMSYYISNEPASDDSVIGNPNLQLSDVTSYDLRLEYLWGEGDLFALSGFYKTIDDPIEALLVRDPSDFTQAGGQFRTFVNNENQGTLWGIEVEARKRLDFVPKAGWLDYFVLGGNFTWIDAQVDRSEVELMRTEPFFAGCQPGNPVAPCFVPDDGRLFDGLDTSRRLFGQPEWIANADVSFDHPDWGTQVTLAFFGISDVLDAAGGPTFIDNVGRVQGYGLDRYVASYYSLDLVIDQSWTPDFLPRGTLGFKFQLRNLTDSVRGVIYDPVATSEEIAERKYRVGRDYKFSISYSF